MLAVGRALEVAATLPPCPETVDRLGQGWVAEEALAIALYCALVSSSFEDGVILAVNHGGDSDSTGAMAGNLLGAIFGASAIPGRWLENLELRDVIDRVATDMCRHFGCIGVEPMEDVDDWDRYPGW